MTRDRIVILALAAGVQLALLLWALGVAKGRTARLLVRLGVVFSAQALAALAFAAGASVEASKHYYAQWLWGPQRDGTTPFLARGDPGLTTRLVQQRPRLTRPPLDDSASVAQWRDSLRGQLQDRLFGWRPVDGPVRYTTQGEAVLDGRVRRRFIAFDAPDGTPVPAYLFEPLRPGRHPAVMVIPGHGEGIIETAGFRDSAMQRAALHLARAGYVVITPELRGFGYLGEVIGNEHRFTAYNAILAGSFYKAVVVRDLGAAMNVLLGLPSVDPRRVGVAGASLGGELSVTYAALDPRVRAVAAHAWSGESIGPAPGAGGGQFGFFEPYCHIVPGQNQYMYGEDWFLLVAPRPMLVTRGALEGAVLDPSPIVRRGYAALHRQDAFRFEVVADGVHEFFVGRTINFFRAHLGETSPAPPAGATGGA